MYSKYFYSIEDVWIIWIVGITLLSVAVYFALRSSNWPTIRRFASDEEGASYALPYLMAFPFYLILVCWVIQSTLIILVKIGVMHSAHAAARSAVVWRSSHPTDPKIGLERAQEEAYHSAVLAIAPYASGLTGHQQLWKWGPLTGTLGEDPRVKAGKAVLRSIAYAAAYEEMAKHSEARDDMPNREFIRRKFILASAMTSVTLKKHNNDFNASLSADVQYTMPIHIPGAGRLLGTRHWTGKGYYRHIRARATLPLETPESESRLLGIQYDPSRI